MLKLQDKEEALEEVKAREVYAGISTTFVCICEIALRWIGCMCISKVDVNESASNKCM